jgi:hypothetical protein
MQYDWTSLVDPTTTLIAAFAGAWFAFLFERRQRRKVEDERRAGVVNRALYTIFNLWNIQVQLKKEIVDEYRGKRDAWLNMPATVPSHYGLTRFEAGDLSFLLDVDGMAYGNLLLEEQRFELAMKLVEERSKLVLTEVFPKLAAAKIGINEARDEREIISVLGQDVVRKLKVLSSGIEQNIDENLVSLVTAHDQLRTAMKKLYPKTKFIKVEFVPQNVIAPQRAA